ncbi:MAG: hypothetical protein Q4F31_09165 [Eubacteriales bacterium]|nr:hypothetical protein [Eubacteriales bacterium]
MNVNKNKKLYSFLIWLCVYAGIFCFCFLAHPQVILDYDDWSYVSYFRVPVPWPSFWNPSRVLPECLMPLCGFLGALVYRLIPSLGYIKAESLFFALVLSAFEMLYLYMFSRLMAKRFQTGISGTVISSAVFFLFHFLIFRTNAENNPYLFRTANLTCMFFYLIPALLNAALVMYFMADPSSFEYFFSSPDHAAEKKALLKKLIVLIVVYFCIFSNLFASIIAAVFAFFEILKGALYLNKNGGLLRNFRGFLRRYSLGFVILLLFLVSVLFEAFGGRAAVSYGDQIPLAEGLRSALSFTAVTAGSVSRAAVCSALAILALFASVCVSGKSISAGSARSSDADIFSFVLVSVLSAIIIGIYIILLSAKVWAEYVERPDILISFFFPLFLAVSAALGRVISKVPKAAYPSAALAVLMALLVNTPGRTFAESYSLDCEVSPETCMALSQDLVDQVLTAEREGKDKVTVEVMFTGNYGSDNWPQVTYLGDVLVSTLRKHGVISGDITVDIFPSDSFNEKYGLVFDPYE